MTRLRRDRLLRPPWVRMRILDSHLCDTTAVIYTPVSTDTVQDCKCCRVAYCTRNRVHIMGMFCLLLVR